MKVKALFIVIAAIFALSTTADAQSLPRRVRNMEVQDLDGNHARLSEANVLLCRFHL